MAAESETFRGEQISVSSTALFSAGTAFTYFWRLVELSGFHEESFRAAFTGVDITPGLGQTYDWSLLTADTLDLCLYIRENCVEGGAFASTIFRMAAVSITSFM